LISISEAVIRATVTGTENAEIIDAEDGVTDSFDEIYGLPDDDTIYGVGTDDNIHPGAGIDNENVCGFAGPKGSVAIASVAETALDQLLEELEVLSWSSGDAGFKFVAGRFKVEISRPDPDHETVSKCWKALQAALVFNAALGLVERLESLLRDLSLA
jgi:hypothetical protein